MKLSFSLSELPCELCDSPSAPLFFAASEDKIGSVTVRGRVCEACRKGISLRTLSCRLARKRKGPTHA